MVRNPYDLIKKLGILKYFFSSARMMVNINKMNLMTIKSQKVTYDSFIYYNNILEEVPLYKYLGIDFHHSLN